MSSHTALYIGEGGTSLRRDGTSLVPNVTVCAVDEAEAEASDLWSPIAPAEALDSVPLNIYDGGRVGDTPIATLDGGTP